MSDVVRVGQAQNDDGVALHVATVADIGYRTLRQDQNVDRESKIMFDDSVRLR